MLLAARNPPNVVGGADAIAWLVDCLVRHMDVVRPLPAAGVSVMDAVALSIATPLQLFAMTRSWRAVALLVEAGAAIGAVDSCERRLLRAVVGEVVGLLLLPGAAVNVQDFYGLTLLRPPAQTGPADAVGLLLQTFASAAVRDLRRETAAVVALNLGHLAVAVALLGAGDPKG